MLYIQSSVSLATVKNSKDYDMFPPVVLRWCQITICNSYSISAPYWTWKLSIYVPLWNKVLKITMFAVVIQWTFNSLSSFANIRAGCDDFHSIGNVLPFRIVIHESNHQHSLNNWLDLIFLKKPFLECSLSFFGGILPVCYTLSLKYSNEA